jgi:hypothetical protein
VNVVPAGTGIVDRETIAMMLLPGNLDHDIANSSSHDPVGHGPPPYLSSDGTIKPVSIIIFQHED